MSASALTTSEVQVLFEERLALLEGTWTLTTRTALYDWNPTLQVYERIQDGLRVQHRAGVKWQARLRCFVPCFCDWCNGQPADELAEVQLYDARPTKE